MIFNKETAQQTAEALLSVNAIKLQPNEPFTWASGWKSPIYCDNRIILSYTKVRNFIKTSLANQIEELYTSVEVIAGVATGAIGIGMLVADALDLPFIYVRPEAKSHGRKNQIEGAIPEDQNVVVIEDLISTGKSSLNAVKALREVHANVLGMNAIFSYGFEMAKTNFENDGIKLYTLSNYRNLLDKAVQTNYITEKEQDILALWNANPSEWNGF